MAKKSFKERLDEIVSTAKSKSKDGKMKGTFSRRMYNEVVNAMVNDPDYIFTTVQLKGGKPEEFVMTPVKDFREKLLTPILNEVRMDSEDQKKFIGNAVEVTMARVLCEALCSQLIKQGLYPAKKVA